MFLLLSPIIFENVTFTGARLLADGSLIICLLILILKGKKIKIPLVGYILSTVTLLILLVNMSLGYDNVGATINNDMYFQLKWLIDDRGINEFVPLGDYYRSTLIYMRYLFIPLYFSIGYLYAKKMGKHKALNFLWSILFVVLIINALYGLFRGDLRLTGFFDNTAALASLAALTILISLFTKSRIKIYSTFIVGVLVLVLSQTVSAVFGLIITLIFMSLKLKNIHKKSIYITIIVSAVISTVGLLPNVLEFIERYMYIGSLLNRLNTWTTLAGYYDSFIVLMVGIGTFPVFADNIFIWLMSGFGMCSIFFYMYLIKVGNYSKESSLFICMIMWQGLFFPGFIMPYMLITTFIILGILSMAEDSN